jgi:hypothetical protein
MDASLIHSFSKDDALVRLMEANEYSVFVAMPFAERFRYSKDKVLAEIICPAAEEANLRLANLDHLVEKRRFAKPKVVADNDRRAKDIHQEIVKGILDAHVVIADLTLRNDGVLIETGLAFGLKPTSALVLLSQEDPEAVHFDVKINVIQQYKGADDVGKVARAMVGAVLAFEEDRKRYLTQQSRQLSPDAVWLLGWYALAQTGRLPGRPINHPPMGLHPQMGICAFLPDPWFHEDASAKEPGAATSRFCLALRELLERRLVWTDYTPGKLPGRPDSFAGNATKLGRMFIHMMWTDVKLPDNNSLPPL